MPTPASTSSAHERLIVSETFGSDLQQQSKRVKRFDRLEIAQSRHSDGATRRFKRRPRTSGAEGSPKTNYGGSTRFKFSPCRKSEKDSGPHERGDMFNLKKTAKQHGLVEFSLLTRRMCVFQEMMTANWQQSQRKKEAEEESDPSGLTTAEEADTFHVRSISTIHSKVTLFNIRISIHFRYFTPSDLRSDFILNPTGHPRSQDKEKTILGCKHYMRKAKIKAACCGKLFPCRLCHDDQVKDHKIDRYATEYMFCMLCKKLGEFGKNCQHCGETMASYHCGVCKFLSGDPTKQIYHCTPCGLCRIGTPGVDTNHCDACGVRICCFLPPHSVFSSLSLTVELNASI